jgi:hypothetical protein
LPRLLLEALEPDADYLVVRDDCVPGGKPRNDAERDEGKAFEEHYRKDLDRARSDGDCACTRLLLRDPPRPLRK